MKKLILFIAIAISITAQAQFNFTTTNKADMRLLADSIALNANKAYTYDKEGVSPDNENFYIVQYKSTSDEDKLSVAFRIENNQYSFYRATGRFTDLFPFWHKFMNKTNTADYITTNMQDIATINTIKFTFKETGVYWKIEAN